MKAERCGTREQVILAAQRLMAHKGYTAVGINEVLTQVHVPKGSFYHYFASKEAFGQAVMDSYFTDYLLNMDRIFGHPQPAGLLLLEYWTYWYELETGDSDAPRCLAVKLGAEVADLSEPMRISLKEGTTAIIGKITGMINAGIADSSLTPTFEATLLARLLYDLWLGASVRAKIDHNAAPLDNARALTRELLGIIA